MYKSCVTISLVPSLVGGPWIYFDELKKNIPKAKALGFDAIELFCDILDTKEIDFMSKLLDDNDIHIAAVGTGAGKALHGLSLADYDHNIRSEAVNYINRMIDLGSQFSASVIIGSMQGKVSDLTTFDYTLKLLGDSLRIISEKAKTKGIDIFYEPLNRYESNLINNLEDAAEFIKPLNIENISLLADLFHMNIEEVSISDALQKSSGYIGHIHLADSNRRPAGMGHINFSEIGRTLGEIGYCGYLSAEALPWPDSDTAAAQTISIFRNLQSHDNPKI